MSLHDPERACPTAPPWWAHPVVGLCIFAVPGLLLAWVMPESTFVDAWGVAKYLSGSDVAGALAAVGAFAAGAAWLGLLKRPRPTGETAEVPDERLERANKALVAITLVGYAAWLVIAVGRGVRPEHLIAMLDGSPGAFYELKQLTAPVAGITTLTQVAPLAGGLMGVLAARGAFKSVRRPAAVLLGLALLRGYFMSERLAIMELVLPFIVAYFVATPRPLDRRRGGPLRSWFPALYLSGAAVVFVAFEFNRSWAYYRLNRAGGYLQFVIERFVGYFATAANNGALLADGNLGAKPPLFTAQWLADFPVLGSHLGLARGRVPLNELLAGVANPDFNTEGGLFSPRIDWGLVPSLFLWFGLGVAAIAVYRRVKAGDTAWVPLFASLYVGVLESGRYFYWGLGRAFVPIVAGLVLARYLGGGVREVTPSSEVPQRVSRPRRPVGSSESPERYA